MVSIDMPAGPSEVLVIADKYANPVHVAADLLSQVSSLFDMLHISMGQLLSNWATVNFCLSSVGIVAFLCLFLSLEDFLFPLNLYLFLIFHFK